MNASVLVIGGAGYIGSQMCHALKDAGWAFTAFDNFSRGRRDAVSGFEVVEGDLREGEALQALLAAKRFDVVMHFAALAYVGESVSEPAAYYDNNVVGSLRLLEAMRVTGHRRLVFSSTCATYGEPVRLPIDERHPLLPVNPYGRTKLMVEQALADYAAAYGIDSISLRYFNAAGADRHCRVGERHQPETHLIPLVLEEAWRVRAGGDPDHSGLVVHGDDFSAPDGTCVRDYIHVEDLCAAHLAAASRLMAKPNLGACAYNLGNGSGYSVLQVIEACRRVTGVEIAYRVGPRRAGDPAALVADARLARQELGWLPAVPDIDSIVASAWNWMLALKQGSDTA